MAKTISIIFRRAHLLEDLESGSFEPIFLTMDRKTAVNTFINIRRSVCADLTTTYVSGNENEFEYRRKGWMYEYKIRDYQLDKFEVSGYKPVS